LSVSQYIDLILFQLTLNPLSIQLSGELLQAFKKASKKDETTKLKAFNELQELFAQEEVSKNIEACLDLWVRTSHTIKTDHKNYLLKLAPFISFCIL
jgi:hypothetical protein